MELTYLRGRRDGRRAGRGWSIWLGVVSLCAGACDRDPESVLRGRVENLLGDPVRAEVSIPGLVAHTRADADGTYALPFVPGSFAVRYEAPGHLPLEVPWLLTRGQEVQVAPVVLVPEPPGEGVWRVTPGGYQPVRAMALRLETVSALGLRSANMERWHIEGAPSPWCRETPLILRSTGGREGAPLVAWPVEQDGTLDATAGAVSRSSYIRQTALSPGVWRIDALAASRVVLLPDVPEERPPGPREATGWQLEVQACGEGS